MRTFSADGLILITILKQLYSAVSLPQNRKIYKQAMPHVIKPQKYFTLIKKN